MGKKRRAWWIVGGLAVVLLSFSWAAFALAQDDGDVMAKISAIIEQKGFEPSDAGDVMFDDFPPDEAVRFVGPHLSEAQCKALLNDLQVPGWTWGSALSSSWSSIAASGATTSLWSVRGFGRRGSFSTGISAESSVTGSNNNETRIEVWVERRTLRDWIGRQ